MTQAIEQLARRFEGFGDEVDGSSPLYRRLSSGVASDEEVLALSASARTGQPIPNLLFGAVHYLLLAGASHPLASYYPSISSSPSDGDPYPAFHDFCHSYRDSLTDLLANRLVQTNEVRRCACLLPAIAVARRRAGDMPLALIEIGASAGLNLFWDRYGYEYARARSGATEVGKTEGIESLRAGGKGTQRGAAQEAEIRNCGNLESPVRLRCNVHGHIWPPLPAVTPEVTSRVGIDLHPVDVRDPDAVAWLRALIWPEHHQRVETLERAVCLVADDPPALWAGDALDLLPAAIHQAAPDAYVCIYHTYTINQFAPAAQEELTRQLDAEGHRRDLSIVSMGYRPGEPYSWLHLDVYHAGHAARYELAHCSGHASWIRWLEPGARDAL